MPQRNTLERAVMLAERAADQRSRVARFTPMPSRPSLSKRGKPGKPWLTKRHTLARLKSMDEAA